jgi:drug/metabolite transporter (DMT)-like permease
MKKSTGILFTFLASVGYGVAPFLTKLAFQIGYNEYFLVLARCVITTIVLFIYMKKRKVNFYLNKNTLLHILKIGILGHGLMIIFLLKSFQYIPTGISIAINFIYPILVMLGMILFYHEKISSKKILASIISVMGIYLIVGLAESNSVNLLGFLMALLSGILYAYYILQISNSPLRKVNSIVLTYYISLINIIPFFLGSVLTKSFSNAFTLHGIMLILLISLIASTGIILFNIGLQIISAVTASIISTMELLTTVVLGVVVLNEMLSLSQLIGIFLIALSVIYIAKLEHNSSYNLSKLT